MANNNNSSSSNKAHAATVQIPVEQIDFSPNISSDAEHFFQSDADIARMAARQGMVNYDKGQAIKVSSKVLDMCVGIKKSSSSSTSTSTSSGVAETEDATSFSKMPIVVEDKALAGATLFTAESGHVARKINLETGKTMKLFQGHIGPVTRVTVYQTSTGRERLITGSWDKSIKVWDTDTKECLATMKGHADFVKALVVRTVLKKEENVGSVGESQRSRIAHELFSASYDGTILHWDLETFQEFRNGAGGPWKGHVRGINDLCLTVEDDNEVSRDEDNQNDQQERSGNIQGKEYLYSAGSDGTIRKWDIERGQGRGGHCVHVFEHHFTTVYRVIVEAVEIWSTSADKTARRLDLETKKVDMTLEHPDFVKSIALAGPYVITGGRQETVRVWSVATGKLIKEIKGHFDEVSSIVVIGSTLFTASLDGTVRRWSLKEQDLLAKDGTESTLADGSESTAQNTSVTGSTATRSAAVPSIQMSADKGDHKPSLMTEEEERELAELMGSDDDDNDI
ncbi:hypothetical protein EDD11_009949 [Mortierella claussenii]|nr:hypothetical protein EDD11_009949 [Mortierella claussenii]